MSLIKMAMGVGLFVAGVWSAAGQVVTVPAAGAATVIVAPKNPGPGYSVTLAVYAECEVPQAGATPLGTQLVADSSTIAKGGAQTITLAKEPALREGEMICVMESYEPLTPAPGAKAMVAKAPDIAVQIVGSGAVAEDAMSYCDFGWSDCDFEYSVVGGVEQSDLSSQTSQTDGFVDLTVRAPVYQHWGTIWLRARFLGAPTTSSNQNVVAAATNPTGTVTSSSLSTVGYAVDYAVGVQHDFFRPDAQHPTRGKFTPGFIVAVGATTPLSSQAATTAYVVPAFGTNECTQLHDRFSTANGYSPALPASAQVTTTTTGLANGPTTSNAMDCSVLPIASTTVSNGVTTMMTETPITAVAFSPVDRSSFLLKYYAGVRLTNRWHSGVSTYCEYSNPNYAALGPCTRSIVDITVGQDEAITGGTLRKFVLKADAIFPIPGTTGIYFFASSSNRLEPNVNLPALVLQSAQISSGTGTPAAGTITVPSPSVFVLPLKQSNRDFYRIGVALDLSSVLPNLFGKGK